MILTSTARAATATLFAMTLAACNSDASKEAPRAPAAKVAQAAPVQKPAEPALVFPADSRPGELISSTMCMGSNVVLTKDQWDEYWLAGKKYVRVLFVQNGEADFYTETKDAQLSTATAIWEPTVDGATVVDATKKVIKLTKLRSWDVGSSKFSALRFETSDSKSIWTCKGDSNQSVATYDPEANKRRLIALANPAPAAEPESMQARWVTEMRAKGGQCVGMADFVESKMDQFGEKSPVATRAFEMASERGCF